MKQRLLMTNLQGLRDQGALMETDQAVAYALSHLDGYLAGGE
jgi:hypothetical protein